MQWHGLVCSGGSPTQSEAGERADVKHQAEKRLSRRHPSKVDRSSAIPCTFHGSFPNHPPAVRSGGSADIRQWGRRRTGSTRTFLSATGATDQLTTRCARRRSTRDEIVSRSVFISASDRAALLLSFRKMLIVFDQRGSDSRVEELGRRRTSRYAN
jgi:hypothetical protein